ncbi:MAG: SURF1 family cytochrome oxidase biogenesis protein [Erythrobacter sp.]|uniref:SURF1 family cytochrome oxidase biogenesis protein n=1 Tax=Erythrobacter sp. TaxID=1042 RepID=UPI0026170F6B|nr:SURF1 family cytochrome oxidase biogenesis protein [Erythrobacter sp.]MDJ0977063.1 SURF1 family cytochrome oxidase biogenesis protein [Erythrobacter sp.]
MIQRLPLIPTVLVTAAVLTMVALGIWQIGRAQEKDARIEALQSRPNAPAAPYPYGSSRDEALLYRVLEAECSRVLSWQQIGGKDAQGRTGWRQIATCLNEPSGATFLADMGVSGSPNASIEWTGGAVTGGSILEPDTRGVIALILRKPREGRLMVIAQDPAPGLSPSKQPEPRAEGNSSWAYAGQWFFFAITALVIYGFAVRSRLSKTT